ncbi:MAG: hypothetical protein AB7I41_01890 [Candidatus Sericytochromatia bacterium]
MKALFKPLSAALLASFLAACSLIPPAQQSSQRQVQAQVQTAADTGQKPPEKVTFPNMVTTTLLEAPEPSEVDEVSALLKAFLDNPSADPGTGFSTASDKGKDDDKKDKDDKHNEQDNNAAYVIEFKSKEAKGKRQILMPETGEFMLTLEAGPRFELLDKDARDGEARVQMPASTLKTWVHLEEAKDNSRLDVSDELYYVKDTLSKERKHKGHHDERDNKWFKLGLRPIPVPSDWYSPDGQAFVLRFKANQIKEFELLLQKQRGEAPFPPGIKQIGPAGGTVELPGVGKLEVPASALLAPVVISMRQVVSTYPFNDFTFVSPIVKMNPTGLTFQKPAVMRLSTFFKNWPYHIGLIQMISCPELKTSPLQNVNCQSLDFETKQINPQFNNIDEVGYLVNHFSYFAKLTDNDFLISTNTLPAPKPNQGGSSKFCLTRISLANEIISVSSARQRLEELCNEPAPDPGHIFVHITNDQTNSALDAAYILAYMVAAEKSYQKFSKKDQANISLPILDDQIPGYTSRKQRINIGSNLIEATTKLKEFKAGSSSVTIPLLTYPLGVEKVYHEMFHVFQFGNLDYSTYIQLYCKTCNYGRLPGESTARFVGSHQLYRDFNNYNILTNFTGKSAFSLIWSSPQSSSSLTAYIEDLLPSIKNTQKPVRLTPDPYQQVSLMSYFWHLVGSSESKPENDYLGNSFLLSYVQSFHNNSDHQVVPLKTLALQNNTIKAQLEDDSWEEIWGKYSHSLYTRQHYGMNSASNLIKIKNDYNIELFSPIDKIEKIKKTSYPKDKINLRKELSADSVHFFEIDTQDIPSNKKIIVFLNNIVKNLGSSIPPKILNKEESSDFAKYARIFLIKSENGIDKVLNYRRFIDKTNGFPAVILNKTNVEKLVLAIPNSNFYESAQAPLSIFLDINYYLAPELKSSKKIALSDDETLTRISFQGVGFDPNDTWMVFQPKSGAIAIKTKVNPQDIKVLSTDSDGLEVQELLVQIPNHAKVSGQTYGLSAETPSNTLNDTAFACNMLQEDFSLTSVNPCTSDSDPP